MPIGGLFGREVEHEDAVYACFFGAFGVSALVLGEYEVVVGVEDYGLLGEGADLANEIEDGVLSHARFEGALGCELVGEAVGEGIGEGDADFEDIYAVFEEGAADGEGGLAIGVARAYVSYETRSVLCLRPGKCFADSVHIRFTVTIPPAAGNLKFQHPMPRAARGPGCISARI